mmetsp:Transcript_12746/g.30119  ORF Transcript_12746/g.30119 Transcript_12746/m.30119 type:complete len:209 (-) Transcript_12746:284-910(-)
MEKVLDKDSTCSPILVVSFVIIGLQQRFYHAVALIVVLLLFTFFAAEGLGCLCQRSCSAIVSPLPTIGTVGVKVIGCDRVMECNPSLVVLHLQRPRKTLEQGVHNATQLLRRNLVLIDINQPAGQMERGLHRDGMGICGRRIIAPAALVDLVDRGVVESLSFLRQCVDFVDVHSAARRFRFSLLTKSLFQQEEQAFWMVDVDAPATLQ